MNFSGTTLTVCSDSTEFSDNHIIGVELYTDVIENHRYSVEKPNETQWSEMTPLCNIRCHSDISENSVADSYLLNSQTSPRATVDGKNSIKNL
jgi:hypothetical protein